MTKKQHAVLRQGVLLDLLAAWNVVDGDDGEWSVGYRAGCGVGFGERPAIDAAEVVLEITQFGSTRSINASAAAAIAMHSWVMQHVF